MKALPRDRSLLPNSKQKSIFKTWDNERVLMSYKEIEQVVEGEFEKKRQELYDEAYVSIMSRSLAYFLYYLYIVEGWREIRLQRAVRDIRNLIKLSSVPLPQGNVSPESIIDMFKDLGYFDIVEEVSK